MHYTVMIPSHKPKVAGSIANSLKSPCIIFDGTDYPSCSKLWNDCIMACPTEIIVMCSTKMRPTDGHVERALELVDDGYGIAGLYRFGFFAFKKDLIRRVGFFDERFIGGNYEDCDMMYRLNEANIAYYEAEQVPYEKGPSGWKHSMAQQHFIKKWSFTDGNNKSGYETLTRLLNNEDYGYQLGVDTGASFLGWDRTVLKVASSWFKQTKVRSIC